LCGNRTRSRKESQLPTGTVKFFNEQKGFGFITPKDGGQDLFVHRSNIQTPDQTLSDSQQVQFEIGQGRKGPEAQNVRPL
jgi:CspA family cold shock protein